MHPWKRRFAIMARPKETPARPPRPPRCKACGRRGAGALCGGCNAISRLVTALTRPAPRDPTPAIRVMPTPDGRRGTPE